MVRLQPGPFKCQLQAVNWQLAGDVAQLGERLVCNQKVAGSIPVVSIVLRLPCVGRAEKIPAFEGKTLVGRRTML